ncbi:aminotransferase class III-fold pyridoxal phosphate-dependent enzyme [Leifsonia virtsii]|uniref:Aminotransferase class III-fold pyridoxal phosphate-dependent enzyme n=1 Tax=Leifsonia virtsii TaxID=3035915 RepID=A0ABT8IVI2_9MICO|nr:aminotransferase class III-fold pyridoxal phosphate-dependent enzyme [Leifsonia virtsii]MDN4596683.1 aminotransferase class III-fold pyridoxal phosphate-dependent enzyme [Leifsonia virtsii]
MTAHASHQEVPSALLKQNIAGSYPTAVRGLGVYLYDEDDREYLDGASGAMTASVGHGIPEVSQAMRRQAELLAFTYRTQFTNEPAEELARRVTAWAPGDLNTAFFVNSGSEATEYAIRAPVSYWATKGQPAKVKILSRQISYHGMTMGALSLSGHSARRPDYGSLLHPFPVAPPAYFYLQRLRARAFAICRLRSLRSLRLATATTRALRRLRPFLILVPERPEERSGGNGTWAPQSRPEAQGSNRRRHCTR